MGHIQMKTRFRTWFTGTAMLAAAISLAAPAVAETTLVLGSGGSAKPLSVTSVSVTISRSPGYDADTGNPIPGSYTLGAGSVYVTRNTDSDSFVVLEALVKGTTFPVVTLRSDPNPDVRGDELTWTLTNVTINNYSTYGGEDSSSSDNFDLTYTKASVSVGSGKSVTWAVNPDGYTASVID